MPVKKSLTVVPVEREDSVQVGGDLVISAITGRGFNFATKYGVETARDLWLSSGASAGYLEQYWAGEEGPRWRVEISAGSFAVRSTDLARSERTLNRLAERSLVGGDLDDLPASDRVVTAWSAKSRARMVQRLCELDYEPLLGAGRVPCMLTLTLPADWLSVAPDAASYKELKKTFRRRYERAWGVPLAAVWKDEYQHRGAPHTHMFMCPPHGVVQPNLKADGSWAVQQPFGVGMAFSRWVAAAWTDVVGHEDLEERAKHLAHGTFISWSEGLRAKDPKRLAVYFTKHGAYRAKEYQNVMPSEWAGQSAGRFWGYWGLSPHVASITVTPSQALAAARTARRWARAQGVTAQRVVWRNKVNLTTGEARTVRRTSRSRVRYLAGSAGFVSVNDGPAFASQMRRYIETLDAGVTYQPLQVAPRSVDVVVPVDAVLCFKCAEPLSAVLVDLGKDEHIDDGCFL